MKTNYKISVPKPCHEDWNQMTPDETGRFCNSCAKSVVDFTNMKAPEIQEYFIKNQGKKVCGRFKNEQLDSIIIQIPSDVLFSQVQFHKMFMLALLISMGTTLFSCQNSNGDKQKIDGVEVVDSIKGKSTVGIIMPKKTTQNDSITKTKCDTQGIKGKTKITKTVYPDIMGDIAVAPQKPNPGAGTKDEIYPASRVEVLPTYPGGLSNFYTYFNSNFKVPEESKDITVKLIFSFVVDTNGNLVDIKLLRGINKDIDSEAMRVLKASPKWIPGEQNGEKVKVSYSLPIKITAQ